MELRISTLKCIQYTGLTLFITVISCIYQYMQLINIHRQRGARINTYVLAFWHLIVMIPIQDIANIRINWCCVTTGSHFKKQVSMGTKFMTTVYHIHTHTHTHHKMVPLSRFLWRSISLNYFYLFKRFYSLQLQILHNNLHIYNETSHCKLIQ
jgi:hypothetical protein